MTKDELFIFFVIISVNFTIYSKGRARRAGSDGRLSVCGSAGPGFDPRRGTFENFQARG